MKKQLQTFTVYLEEDEDGMVVGSVPNLPGCYADGKNVQEVMNDLSKIIPLCLRNQKQKNRAKFIGLQNLEIAYA